MGTAFRRPPASKILFKPMSGGQGCFHSEVKAAICGAPARTGLLRLPSCAFARKGISPCAQGDQRRCLWNLPPLKRRTKLYNWNLAAINKSSENPGRKTEASNVARPYIYYIVFCSPSVGLACVANRLYLVNAYTKPLPGQESKTLMSLTARIRCVRRHRRVRFTAHKKADSGLGK